MIAFLSGRVRDLLVKSVILDCRGVGYELFLAGDYLSAVKVGDEVELYVHTHVREDQLTLYGFESLEKREFFRQLISVSGIGPKIAMDMLSKPVAEIKEAIEDADVVRLSSTPGVGKKTAQRMIVELKGKISYLSLGGSVGSASVHVSEEAILALEGLGYRRQQIVRSLAAMPAEIVSAEDMVTYFLRNA